MKHSKHAPVFSESEIRAHAAKHGLPLPSGLAPLSSDPAYRSAVDAAAKGSRRKLRIPNGTESDYERMLRAKFPEANIRYEGYTLKLAEGCRYVPDFAVEHPDGRLEFHEVKGAFIFSKALTKPKTAAELFPQRFVLAQKLKSGWEITELRGRIDHGLR